MSIMVPIANRTFADQAFDKIVSAIVRGELKPGARISEVELARQLGISRGPLREALGRLEGKRLVSRTPHIGFHVVDLTYQDLVELFTIREALEGIACRLAATSMTDSDLDDLRRLLDRHEKSEGLRTGKNYYQRSADEDFHFLIVRASRNTRLVNLLCEELYSQLRIYRYRSSITPGRARAAFQEHLEIVSALADRDPDRAEAAMRQHVANARANLKWMDRAGVAAGEGA